MCCKDKKKATFKEGVKEALLKLCEGVMWGLGFSVGAVLGTVTTLRLLEGGVIF